MKWGEKPEVPPVPDDWASQHQYALETLELANSNWHNVGRPWRFRQWLEIDRLVRARQDALRKAIK